MLKPGLRRVSCVSTQVCCRQTYGLLEVDLVVENGHFLELVRHGNVGINREQRGVQRRHGPLTTATEHTLQFSSGGRSGGGQDVCVPYLTLSGKN